MKKLSYILFIFLLYVTAYGSDSTSTYSLDISINRYSFKGDFKNLGGNPDCCPDLRTGTGTSPSFIFSRPFKLYGSSFDLSLGLSYISGEMRHEEDTDILLNDVSYNGVLLHSIDFDIVLVNLTMSKNFNVSDFDLSLGLGSHFWISSNYYQKEELVEPNNRGVFSDTKTRLRNEYESAIPNHKSLIPFVNIRAAYQIIRPLDNQFLSLKPFITAEIPFSSFINEGDWTYFRIGAGISFSFKY